MQMLTRSAFFGTVRRFAESQFTQDAPTEDKVAFLRKAAENGFALVPLTVNLNGKDTLIAHGAAVLHTQPEVDAEFTRACAMGFGAIHLTHVTHNPADAASVRVR